MSILHTSSPPWTLDVFLFDQLHMQRTESNRDTNNYENKVLTVFPESIIG